MTRSTGDVRGRLSDDPSAYYAHSKLDDAVKRGLVARPVVCEGCQEERPLSGHHDDYDRPLEVRWLCQPCHTALHDGKWVSGRPPLEGRRPMVTEKRKRGRPRLPVPRQRVTLRLDRDVLALLEQAAARQRRTVSNLIEVAAIAIAEAEGTFAATSTIGLMNRSVMLPTMQIPMATLASELSRRAEVG